MKTPKLKQIFVAGLTTLALAYGCANYAVAQNTTKDLEKIVLSESSKNKIVMFGETHIGYRKDSDFVIKILSELKKQGFNYFALELVRISQKEKNSPAKILSRIFTDYVSGKITKEDIYLNNHCTYLNDYSWTFEDLEDYVTGWLDLVDKAKRAGMKIVYYDANHEEYSSFNEREEKAFKNLKELIFDKDPKAKVIVYSGGNHLNEKEAYNPNLIRYEEFWGFKNKSQNGKFKCLAYHLNQYTQGKILTVSLRGSDKYVKYCDMALDLDKNKCLRNKPYNKGE